ncbi:AraC family transcriptional regulator [Haloferula sp. BvORR071]|uniref:AraC family transcriptional regulator n=1 Tax=Haloferula sp. BvORR071 TaxID=1396141 RepID=UPI000697B339|nr:AraC family transcriptional regulator [Haloferula sp. BvORR071]
MAIDTAFISKVDSPRFCERLFAVLPDVMFCLKDTDRRYRAMNQAFVERIGLKDTRRLIGRLAEEFFPKALAETYKEQDDHVLGTGSEIIDQLELSLNRDGSQGWYLATKVPLHDRSGKIIGLASVSRDLRAPSAGDAELAGVAKVAEYVRDHLDSPLRAADLATIAKLSPTQLERRMHRVFQLSTTQFVRKSRIEHAARLLRDTPMAIAEVALECGYGDQTALTRQFRSMVGMPPAAYRDHVRKRS